MLIGKPGNVPSVPGTAPVPQSSRRHRCPATAGFFQDPRRGVGGCGLDRGAEGRVSTLAVQRARRGLPGGAYQETYRGGDFQVILQNGWPAGRLYLARWEREIRIVDIALLPEYRKAGIGSAILKDILAEGARGGKRVSIHVEMFNPALTLYERLGFRKLREHGVYYFMEWSPESSLH
jgi:ribosomal protein S18 acetylase RimI-like enzyme